MEPNQKPKVSVRDFFLNLGSVIALYTVMISLVNLLFTIINTAYPQTINSFDYVVGSTSISWPVSVMVIFFPILIVLMWMLEKEYATNPERQRTGIHKWLSYITLFVSGLIIAGDLIAVLYKFLDGQELTTGFLLKILVLAVIAGGIFTYYISDIRGRLTSPRRKLWRIVTAVVVLGSIIWGFSVLGSPRTQRLYKYDTQKVYDLQSINSYIQNYYATEGKLPSDLSAITSSVDYAQIPMDAQNKKAYEYSLQSQTTYEICADFNKATNDRTTDKSSMVYPAYPGSMTWTHPAGHYCFQEKINPNMFPSRKLPM